MYLQFCAECLGDTKELGGSAFRELMKDTQALKALTVSLSAVSTSCSYDSEAFLKGGFGGTDPCLPQL